MGSLDSSKSSDSSPSYHPMILRSACRFCCAVESQSPPLTVDPDTTIHSRNVRKSRLNGNFLNFHNHHYHHHHHHHHLPEGSVKKHVEDSRYVDASVSQAVASQLSSATRKETKISENTALRLSDSFHKSSLAEQITSSLNVNREVVRNSSFKGSSASMYKEVHSDYSSGEENEFLYGKGFGGEVNSLSFEEAMSQTRAQIRTPLPSSRFALNSDSEESIDATTILRGRHNETSRTRSTHLMDSNVDSVGLSGIFSYSNSGKQTHRNISSRRNNLYSAGGSSNDVFQSNETLVEESLLSPAASSSLQSSSHSGFIFTMFRWLFWRCIYHSTCEVLLFDSWLLLGCSTFGKKKILFLLLLLLIPLWFFGALSTENCSSDLHNHLDILESAGSVGSLFSYSSLRPWFSGKSQESDSLPICSEESETSRSVWSYMWNMFSSKEVDSVKRAEHTASSKSDIVIPVPDLVTSDEKIRMLALEVFKKESNQLVEQLEKRSKQHNVEQDDMKMVHSEIDLVSAQYQSLSDSLKALKSEIREQQKSDVVGNVQNHPQLLLLNTKLQDLEEKIQAFESLLASAKNCCRNQSDYLIAESQLTSLLVKVMEGHENENHPILSAFQNWLRSSFISRKNLSDEIVSVIKDMYGDSLKFSQEHYEDIAKRVAESVISKSLKSLEHDVMINVAKTTSSSASSEHYLQGAFKVDDIQKIVKEAILLYDADKTGRVDYALESGGGSIISTRCSETYNAGTGYLSIFGLPLWYTSKSPRTAIQPEVQPGECWAFHGSQGFLVIHLSATIRPTGFSMEHVPKSLSPTGTIDSAPKEFSVWGLTSEKNGDGKLLGQFVYESDGDPLQYYPVEDHVEDYYSVIELKIHSNWGNQKYTCLYRFRVHGTPL